MAEFQVSGLDDLVIKIEDDALGDAVEYHTDQLLEKYMENYDPYDQISDSIWSFNQWDEIINKEIGRGSLDLNENDWSAERDNENLQSLLDEFSENIDHGRTGCRLHQAFHNAVVQVVEQVVDEIVAPRITKMIDEVIEIKKVTEKPAAVDPDFTQELEQTIGRITKQHIKMAGRQSLFTLDRIWPPTGQTSGMALRGMEKVEEESEATRD